jgi:hypothetical protein
MVTKIFPAAYVDGIRDVSHAGTFAFRWCIPSWAWSEDGKPLPNLARITRYQRFESRFLQQRCRERRVWATVRARERYARWLNTPKSVVRVEG